MKTTTLHIAAHVSALPAATAQAQTAPKMKMTTDIPPAITMPDSVETRLGTLKFSDGFPDKATVEKVYDNLDFQRGSDLASAVYDAVIAAGVSFPFPQREVRLLHDADATTTVKVVNKE